MVIVLLIRVKWGSGLQKKQTWSFNEMKCSIHNVVELYKSFHVLYLHYKVYYYFFTVKNKLEKRRKIVVKNGMVC
jgi:hypothetical protein